MSSTSDVRYFVRFVGCLGYAVHFQQSHEVHALKELARELEIDSFAVVASLGNLKLDPKHEITAEKFDELIQWVLDEGWESVTQISNFSEESNPWVEIVFSVKSRSLNCCISKGVAPFQLSDSKLSTLISSPAMLKDVLNLA